jgi:hypothetical protein
MIIDVHSHLSTLEQWGPVFAEAFGGAYKGSGIDLDGTPDKHYAATGQADRVVVFGINSISMQMCTPNDDIAAYVRQKPDKMIGFMSVDPNDPKALDEIERCAGDLGLRGIKMSPVYQNYHPCDERAGRIHRRAEELGLPILTHSAFQCMPNTPMKWANPLLYDPVAQQFPDLKIILAHMGVPWFTDAMVMVRKHTNVFADISGITIRPWAGYQALVEYHEFAVTDKLLFGTDWPVIDFEGTVSGLRGLSRQFESAAIPTIPDEVIEGIIHRDSLELLGIG